MSHSYMTYTPRQQVINYLASLMTEKDHWFFLIPVALAEPVLGALVQFPDAMLFMDQGSTDICISGGRHMLIPLAVTQSPEQAPERIGMLATVPRKDISRRDIIATLSLPDDALKPNQFVLGLQSSVHGAMAVFPVMFTDALALVDPEAAEHFRTEEP
jgi:hypothetical protein